MLRMKLEEYFSEEADFLESGIHTGGRWVSHSEVQVRNTETCILESSTY